jgi:hypothetical protein
MSGGRYWSVFNHCAAPSYLGRFNITLLNDAYPKVPTQTEVNYFSLGGPSAVNRDKV